MSSAAASAWMRICPLPMARLFASLLVAWSLRGLSCVAGMRGLRGTMLSCFARSRLAGSRWLGHLRIRGRLGTQLRSEKRDRRQRGTKAGRVDHKCRRCVPCSVLCDRVALKEGVRPAIRPELASDALASKGKRCNRRNYSVFLCPVCSRSCVAGLHVSSHVAFNNAEHPKTWSRFSLH